MQSIRRAFSMAVAIACLAWAATTAVADVVVVANRTSNAIACAAVCEGQQKEFTLAAGDLRPLRVRGPLEIAYRSRGRVERYELLPNSVYFFAQNKVGGEVRLHQIGLRAGSGDGNAAADSARRKPETFSTEGKTITVKILVDDDQPLLRHIWEPDLRQRIADCSDILRKHCFVRLKVVAVDVWDSDDATTDFSRALREFEREVDTDGADVAIGFTSQFHVTSGRTNLGGIREPFSRHVLIREWRHRASASGRLELLVHELGHYLGAAHSPEQESVMRPVLADKQANAVGFRVGYDPVNTLAVNLVAEELLYRDLRKYHQLTPWTKNQLMGVYAEIGRALPKDPAARQFIALMNIGRSGGAGVSGVVGGTRHVLAAIVTAAERNQSRATGTGGELSGGPLTGDELTELYVREAAGAAAKLDKKTSRTAFLLALAIALGQTDSLKHSAVIEKMLGSIENDQERRRRQEVLGEPTMHGRRDLLAHFVVSAALAAAGGSRLAESAGFLKEYADARGQSGFSFADLAADYAGIHFAMALGRTPTLMRELGRSFKVSDFAMSPAGLPEGLSSSDFLREYGTSTDERYLSMRETLLLHVKTLPGYLNTP